MPTSSSVTALAPLLLLTGCVATWSTFEPYSSTSEFPRSLDIAVRAYRGDLEVLAAAGAKVVGFVDASGNGYAGVDDVQQAAAAEAASHGGTHYVVGATDRDVSYVQVGPATATTQVEGKTARTTYYPPAEIPITRYSTTLLVVRVPPEGWALLPPPLRPRSGEHFNLKPRVEPVRSQTARQKIDRRRFR